MKTKLGFENKAKTKLNVARQICFNFMKLNKIFSIKNEPKWTYPVSQHTELT